MSRACFVARFAPLFVVALLSACGGGGEGPDGGPGRDGDTGEAGRRDAGPPPPPIDGGEPRIAVGTGQLEFVEISPGDEVELTRGSQGGVHIDVTMRIWSTSPEDLLIRYEGYDDETGEELFFPLERVLVMSRVVVEGDHLLRVGDRLIVDEGVTTPAEVVGRPIRIEASASPLVGDTLTDTVVVLAVDNE